MSGKNNMTGAKVITKKYKAIFSTASKKNEIKIKIKLKNIQFL